MNVVSIQHQDSGQAPAEPVDSARATAQPALQCLSWRVGGQGYLAPVTQLLEVRVQTQVTALVHTAAFLLGVLNLRGAPVPVVDLRLRFGMEPAGSGRRLVIVVLAGHDDRGHARWVGVVVDEVCDIVAVEPHDVHPLPDLPFQIDARYLTGLARLEGDYVPIVDFARLLSPAELELAIRAVQPDGGP